LAIATSFRSFVARTRTWRGSRLTAALLLWRIRQELAVDHKLLRTNEMATIDTVLPAMIRSEPRDGAAEWRDLHLAS
jgi:hypothetical protein